MNLVSNYFEKNILSEYSKNQLYSINNVVEITDQNRCILFGPPCIIPNLGFVNNTRQLMQYLDFIDNIFIISTGQSQAYD